MHVKCRRVVVAPLKALHRLLDRTEERQRERESAHLSHKFEGMPFGIKILDPYKRSGDGEGETRTIHSLKCIRSEEEGRDQMPWIEWSRLTVALDPGY